METVQAGLTAATAVLVHFSLPVAVKKEVQGAPETAVTEVQLKLMSI